MAGRCNQTLLGWYGQSSLSAGSWCSHHTNHKDTHSHHHISAGMSQQSGIDRAHLQAGWFLTLQVGLNCLRQNPNFSGWRTERERNIVVGEEGGGEREEGGSRKGRAD
mgnify:CR=1 FL=1